jgi:hypothetical protein
LDELFQRFEVAVALGFAGFLTGKVLDALRFFYIDAPSPG